MINKKSSHEQIILFPVFDGIDQVYDWLHFVIMHLRINFLSLIMMLFPKDGCLATNSLLSL